MWTNDNNFPAREFCTPPPPSGKSRRWSPGTPMMPLSEKKPSPPRVKADLFHVIHKVPAGDSPYVRAKHVQLLEKDPSRAISLFWAAINSGDRVDSALKDMAVVMKQLDRSDEAIEAIKSFRHLSPPESQESLDNLLVELYKRSGRFEEQIEMLQRKVKTIEEGVGFRGRRTKCGRSQGKKIQITIEQEYSRLLGNLAWAYMQQCNFKSAEEFYRKALSLEPDKNKQCNLAICMMNMNRMTEAKFLLQTIRASPIDGQLDDSYANSYERATQMLMELESKSGERPIAGQEESHKEIQMPFASVTHKNLEEFPTLKYGGHSYVSGSRMSDVGHDKEALLSTEPKRGFCSQRQHESKNIFSGSDDEYTSFRRGNCSQPSFVETLKKGSYGENPYERTPDFVSRRNDKWVSTGGKEIGSFYKKAYASPRVPFTQPKRGPWSFGNGDQRKEILGDGVVGGCNRKLSFEQATYNNVDGLAASNTEMTNTGQQKSSIVAPCVNGNWRRRCQGYLAEVNGESSLQTNVSGDFDRNYRGNHVQKILATKEREMPIESLEVLNSTIQAEVRDQSSNICMASSVRLTETVENRRLTENNSRKSGSNHEAIQERVNPGQEHQIPSYPIAGNLEHSLEISKPKCKKTWADMVEEDEQEFLRENSAENTLVYPFEESSFSSQTPSRRSDQYQNGETFNDENINSNIPTPLGQIQKLSQKISSFSLRDGYYTQPKNHGSPMNQTVGQSLCFEQQQKPGRTDTHCSSPLSKKVLDFEGSNSFLENKREGTSGSGIKLLRRDRLKVFRDMTESPRVLN